MRKLVLILCAIFAFLTSARAQSIPQTLILEDPGWRVNIGDDPAFASPTFDDSAWRPCHL